MKILVQCNYDPENLGGIEMVTRNLLDVLISHKLNIEVFASSNIDTLNHRIGYTFRGLKILGKISGTPFLLWGNIRFIASGIRSDLILFQEPFPTLLPALFILRFLFRKKIIVLVHAIPHMPSFIAGTYDRIRKIILSRVSVVTTSPVLLDQLKLKSKSHCSVIPLCFNESAVELCDASKYREQLNLPILPDRFILFFGRLAGYKGLEVLMPSILKCPEIPLVIAGAGIMENFISDFIDRNNLKNVLFINRLLNDAEKFYLIKHCYALVLPSVNSSEAFAIVQLEAMYFSRPIINTNLKNGVNYVAPSNVAALTVTPGDIDALTNAIKMLWNNYELAIKLGLGGRQRFEDLFSKHSFSIAWSKYFSSLT